MFGVSGATCALIGASTHRFARCRATGDFAAWVNRVHTLALVAASLSGIVALLSTLVAFGLSAACGSSEDAPGQMACAELTEVTLIFALW